MIVDNTFPLRGWLNTYKTLQDLSFTDEEIDKALEINKITRDTLTETKRYPQLKGGRVPFMFDEKYQRPCILVKKGRMHMRVYHPLHKSFTKIDCVPGYEILEPSRQTTVETTLLRTLLTMRLPWFSLMQWRVYSFNCKNNVEIYLTTSHKGPVDNSVYCPVTALLKKDKNAIIERNIEYFSWYCQNKPKDYLDYQLKTLQSPEARKLFEFLDTPQEK